eukprot:PhM_4_TR12640/c0_g1_i1/m.53179/K15104/SLC25A11, OGC; solute carrier family 25 (mitochondrial oxoglutarate transporter), member 11
MSNSERHYPAWMVFPASTVSGMAAWTVVHPMDLLKVRMQMANQNHEPASISAVLTRLMKERGAIALFDGLSAGLARQVVYSTIRLGCYDVFRDAITGGAKPEDTTMLQRLLAGASSGSLAAFLSCPIEVALVRMQGDAQAPEAQRRNYTSVFNALSRVAREEGVATFWRGATPTVARATVVGITQVGFYDQAKAWLMQANPDVFTPAAMSTFVCASLLTGVFYSFVTMPIETAKIRMQSQRGTKYTGLLQSMACVAKEEGVTALWRGYLPYYARCGGHTLGCFFLLEQIKKSLNWAYAPKHGQTNQK